MLLDIRRLLMVLALLSCSLFFAFTFTSPAFAATHAQDPNNCYDWAPPDVNVISCWGVQDQIQTGRGVSIACVVLDDNPLGYYTSYTTYVGFSYEGSNGNMYIDRDKDGNPFPYSVTGVQNSVVCGTD